MSESTQYPIPDGQLSLSGPVDRPVPGTLPLRGDVAHIALANRYLVPHYVVPVAMTVAGEEAPLLLAEDDASHVLRKLQPGEIFEALDVTATWVWGACGPDGPSGYVKRSAFAD